MPSAANSPFFPKFLIAIAFGIAIDRFPIPAFSAPLRELIPHPILEPFVPFVAS